MPIEFFSKEISDGKFLKWRDLIGTIDERDISLFIWARSLMLHQTTWLHCPHDGFHLGKEKKGRRGKETVLDVFVLFLFSLSLLSWMKNFCFLFST